MKKFVLAGLLACLLPAAPALHAQPAYPARMVNAVVGFPPGGISDLILRQLVSGMKGKFPNGLIVVNKAGGGGTMALSSLVEDKPDGYNFAIAPNANLNVGPQIADLRYKNPDDYDVLLNIVSSAPVAVVKADSPITDGTNFVATAKAKGDALSVGYPGEASISQLSLAQIRKASSIKIIGVPFAGWGQGAPALLGGHVDMMMAQPGEVVSFLQNGTLRAVGTVSPVRLSALPHVPTWKEQGFDVGLVTRYYLIVPKGTPAPVKKYIHDAAKAAMEEPAFKEFAKNKAVEIDYLDAEQSKVALWDEYRKDTELLRQVGLLKNAP